MKAKKSKEKGKRNFIECDNERFHWGDIWAKSWKAEDASLADIWNKAIDVNKNSQCKCLEHWGNENIWLKQ